ncbi:MAG TPA: transposase [Verrucomicrobiae bacterium]|nr:transposase [Verrucomicrobiae bacterium]
MTICTENKRPYFGRVVGGAMALSDIGEQAASCWKDIPRHHSNVEIDEWIVMPNHLHGIIVISGPERLPELRQREKIRRVMELSAVHPKADSLGSVVGSFKSAVSKWCGLQGRQFEWQDRFHDRIIRGKNSLSAIRQYIRDNPKNWEKDTEFVA